MNKSLLVGASLVLALNGCSNEPDVVDSKDGLEGNFYMDTVLMECRDKYEEFFLSEICYQSETDYVLGKYFVPEVVRFHIERSGYSYTDNEQFNFESGGNTAFVHFKDRCEVISNDCIQKSYYLILRTIEIELKNEKNLDKRKEWLFVYFHILDKWLASLA